MQGSSVCIVGEAADVQREVGWIRTLLPHLFNEPNFHCAMTNGMPDSFPDIAIHLGLNDPQIVEGTFNIWIHTNKQTNNILTPGSQSMQLTITAATGDPQGTDNNNDSGVYSLGEFERQILQHYNALVSKKPDDWLSVINSNNTNGGGGVDQIRVALISVSKKLQTLIPTVRASYWQIKRDKEAKMCLNAAKTFNRLGRRTKTRDYLHRLLGPLLHQNTFSSETAEIKSEAGPPIPNYVSKQSQSVGDLSEIESEAVTELVQLSRSEEKDPSEDDDSIRRLDNKALKTVLDNVARRRGTRAFSCRLAAFEPLPPFVTAELLPVTKIGLVSTAKEKRLAVANLERQLLQIQQLARLPFPKLETFDSTTAAIDDLLKTKTLDSTTDAKDSKTQTLGRLDSTTVKRTEWMMVIRADSPCIAFAPMFLRDWSSLVPLLSSVADGGWGLIRLGWELPAIETLNHLTDSKPKRFTALSHDDGVGHGFAFLISHEGAKTFPNTKSISLSSPALVASPI